MKDYLLQSATTTNTTITTFTTTITALQMFTSEEIKQIIAEYIIIKG